MAFLNNGITGHRGNPVDFPENTLASFADAIVAGVDWIELDVRLSKDSKLIVIHDENTGRTCDSDVLIHKTESSELRKLDAGANARPPFLEEVLELIGYQTETRVSIQPKVDCVSQICEVIKSMDMEQYTGFNDGDSALLLKAKCLLPDTKIFYDLDNAEKLDAAIEAARKHDFAGIVLYHLEMTQELAGKINAAGFESGVWTVNDPEDFMRLRSMGVKRFYTDCPRKFIELI
jgi:glycerophosphoryl diester phosphodiesterase